MKRNLSPWCKEVRIAMIRQEISPTDLAKAIGRAREYVTSVISGRVYSVQTAKLISDYLNVENNYSEEEES